MLYDVLTAPAAQLARQVNWATLQRLCAHALRPQWAPALVGDPSSEICIAGVGPKLVTQLRAIASREDRSETAAFAVSAQGHGRVLLTRVSDAPLRGVVA